MNNEKAVTLEYAEKSFADVARIADCEGEAYIEVDGVPRYMLVSLEGESVIELTHEEKVDIIAKRVLKKYERAFRELAK